MIHEIGHRTLEQMAAPNWPTIALNHLGFRPRVSQKVLVVRALATPRPAQFTLRDVSERPFRFTRPLNSVTSDFGPCLVADFTDLDCPGLYQMTVGDEHSVQFAILEDVWRRTLPKAVGYYRYRRCGVEVPGVHSVCHLDDARRRDNGQHVDVVGGWHDAGDLRKWMDVTMLNGIALLNLLRNFAEPRPGDPTHEQILEEVRFGNRYFLKMQDTDGKIWADTAGGVNGDNSDNHWTDNIVGTNDDRYINTAKRSDTAAVFATLEGLVAQCYAKLDAAYARQCLEAGVHAWKAFDVVDEALVRKTLPGKNPNRPPESTQDYDWWAFAACELFRATQDAEFRDHAMLLGRDLLRRQEVLRINQATRGADQSPPSPVRDLLFSVRPPANAPAVGNP